MMNNNTCTQLSEHLDVTNLRIMLAKEKTFNTRKLLDRYLWVQNQDLRIV